MYKSLSFVKESLKCEADLLNAAFHLLGVNANVPIPATTATDRFPKYNSYRLVDDNPNIWYMEFALTGYEKSSICVKLTKEDLIVFSKPAEEKEKPKDRIYSYRGLAKRPFVSKFHLGKNVEVKSAKFADGLLTIKLEKLTPKTEEENSEYIEIT